jgi:hypothetical protein
MTPPKALADPEGELAFRSDNGVVLQNLKSTGWSPKKIDDTRVLMNAEFFYIAVVNETTRIFLWNQCGLFLNRQVPSRRHYANNSSNLSSPPWSIDTFTSRRTAGLAW